MQTTNQTPSGTVTKGVTRDEGKRRLAALREALNDKPTTGGKREQ